jgi:hypothetical protein
LDSDIKKVDEIVDNFLKELILNMEKVKELINSKVSIYHSNLVNYYQQYRQRVEGFLKQSIESVMVSETMQNY